MPATQKFLIPDDYVDGETEWSIVTMCIPNTRQWRGVVSGAIYGLSRGRIWDEKSGIITTAQEIGLRIYDSMAIDCNNIWERIAMAQESINEKTPDLITLSEFLSDIENSTIGDLADWITIGGVLGDMLPNISIKLSPVDWIRMVMEILWKRRIAKAAEDIAFQLKIGNFVEGGETVAEGVEAIDGVIDDVSDWASVLVQGLGATALGVSAYADIRDSFAQEGADEDLELRNINRIYNDVFVEGDGMTNIQTNTQIVNCCGSNCEFPEESPVGGDNDLPDYDLADSPEVYPVGFEDFDEWEEYRCKAAHAMIYNIAETMYQIYQVAFNQFDNATRTGLITAYVAARKGAGLDPFVGWLYSEDFVNQWLLWEAELVVDYIWEETDLTPFDIFSDLRLEMLSDVETWACSIFMGDTTSEIRVNFLDLVDAYFGTTGYTSEVQSWAYDVVNNCLSNAWLGIPFKPYENIQDAVITPTPDCTDCGVTYEDWTVAFGTLVSGSIEGGTEEFTVRALWDNGAGCVRYQAQITVPPDHNYNVTLTQTGGVTPKCCLSPCYNAFWKEVGIGNVYHSNTTPALPDTVCLEAGSTLWVRYEEVFDMTITVNGVCDE